MLEAELAIAAIEIAHLAGAHVGGTDGQAWRAAIDQLEIDEFA